ncbi:MAG: response regulator transcription factor [Rikenellaceae bacterium]
MNTSYKIIIVDDHTLFRSGLRTLLETISDIKVLEEFGNGQELLDYLAVPNNQKPDVVLLDIEMPILNGIETMSRISELYPNLNVLTLSMYGEQEYYFKMVSLGVKGFMLKNSDIKDVVSAIGIAATGGSYFSQELLCNLVNSLRTSPKTDAQQQENELSEREQEILLLICQGLSNQNIADQLFISKRTVDKHRANILFKTGCKNTANLVVYAIKNSLVEI